MRTLSSGLQEGNGEPLGMVSGLPDPFSSQAKAYGPLQYLQQGDFLNLFFTCLPTDKDL